MPGLFHSGTNQAKPAAASSGPKRLSGRRSQQASPQPIERPAGGEQSAPGERRRAGEPVAGIVAGDVEREDADRDVRARRSRRDRSATHAPNRRTRRRTLQSGRRPDWNVAELREIPRESRRADALGRREPIVRARPDGGLGTQAGPDVPARTALASAAATKEAAMHRTKIAVLSARGLALAGAAAGRSPRARPRGRGGSP